MFHRRGNYDRAIADYSESIRQNQSNAASYYGRGVAYKMKGNYELAIADFNDAIRLDPNQPLAYFNRGDCYQNKHAYPQALADFNAAIRLNPKESQLFISRGATRVQQHDYDLALNDFNEAIRLKPAADVALNLLARLLATCPQDHIRNGKKAVEYARQACELTHWKNSAQLSTLAAAYAEAGQFDEAVTWQNKALADPAYEKISGDPGRAMLALFKQKQPFRDK